MEKEDPVGDGFDKANLMTHVDHRAVAAGKIADQATNALGPIWVETAGDFVEHEDPWAKEETTRQRHALT